MAKILGLDLGTNSIGWAVVEKKKDEIKNNNEYKTILKDKGVVIFSEGVKTDKRIESSKAAERTGFRSARRIKFRRKLRKYETLKVLAKNSMCPLTIDEVIAWRKSNFKNYPNNSTFLSWLQTDNFGEKENQEHKIIRKKQEDNPYFYRDKFSRQKYDWENNKTLKEELGRAFYHIAQRRGFLSNRLEQSDNSIIEDKKDEIEEIINSTTNKDELQKKLDAFLEDFDKNEDTEKALFKLNKSFYGIIKNSEAPIDELKKKLLKKLDEPENLGKVKKDISDLSKEIKKANCETLGQYFYSLYKADRNIPDNKIRSNYTAREEHYLREFEIICKTQVFEGINENKKSPDKRYCGLVKELYDAIFYQRPLKSQKGLVGNCSFEKNKARCPVSHPLFEEYRMWSFINNIKIKTPDDEKLRVLYKSEKEKIIPKFYRKSKAHFDFEDLIKDLIPKDEKAEYYKSREAQKYKYLINYKLNTTVSGCPTSANLKSIFGDDWKTLEHKHIARDKNGKEINLTIKKYEIAWHALFTFDKVEKLKEFAEKKLNLYEKKVINFSKINLKKDYASLSLTAIKKILPYLEQGLIYSHAVFMANAEKVVDKEIWDDEQKRNLLQNAIKKVIDNNTLDNQITQVINGLIKNCKNSDNNFTYNEQSKESYKKDVENALQSFYGKNSWKELENNNEILENSCNIFFKQLKKKGGTGEFIKPKRTDEKVVDLLLGRNETGEVYCSDETRIKKLYHPSDIEQFITIKNKNGNEFTSLGSPATPSVRNPMAMRSLFQLRKLVNTLILEKKIDKDTKINIELARELNDANKRNAIEQWQRERKELHDIYAKKIKELYLAAKGKEIEPSESDILKFQLALEQREDCKIVSKEDVLKYQLWEEQKHICLYTGNTIGLTDFLNKNPKYDIEHTIPRSISEDNSQMNKTLCDVDFNRKTKGNKIPFELSNYNKILPRIKHWKEEYEKLDKEIAKAIKATKAATTKEQKDIQIRKRHYLALHRDYWKGKYERFIMKDVPQSFKNSQKVDIGIISKYAREYLSSVFKNKNGNSNVYSVKGEMTAEFRKAWGLQESFINEFGKKDYKPKDRSNHIHHCIDAITIACMNKNKYDTLAHAWSLEEKGDLESARKKLEKSKPWKNFKEDVEEVGDEVFIVHHTADNVKKQSKKVLRKRGKKQYVIEFEKNKNGKYLKDNKGKKIPKKDEHGKIIYKLDKEGNKIPIIQQGDTVRGSLHQETFYGAIKQTLKNDKGKIIRDENNKMQFIEDKSCNPVITYVVRKNLMSLKKSEVEKIIDLVVKQKIEKAIKDNILIITSNDQQANKLNDTVWMNEEKKIPINKVRIKANTTSPLKIKKHRDISKESHKYKEFVYATNEENYCMVIYEGKDKKGAIKRSFKLVNMIDAGEYYRLSNKKYRLEHPLVPKVCQKKGYPLKMVGNKPIFLTKGTSVIFYKKNNEEIWKLPENEKQKRLYKIIWFEGDGRIQLMFHQTAMQQSSQNKEEMTIVKYMKEKKLKNSIVNFENPVPWLRLSKENLNFIVQNIDFKISPTGKITKIEK